MKGTREIRLIVLAAVLVAAWGGATSVAQRQPTIEPSVAAPAGVQAGLVTHVISQEGRPHTLVVADAPRKVVAVYHVDPLSGKLALKSVRNVTWDLEMLQYETSAPTPQDVRAGLPR